MSQPVQVSTERHAGLTERFDHMLRQTPHYALYPEMMVAVGAHYGKAPAKILLLGESDHVDSTRPENVPERWYAQRELDHTSVSRNIDTRNVFNNTILGRAPKKSKAIFHALSSALSECGMAIPGAHSALQSVAYMNFFQRPAERPKESIVVHPRDVAEANQVLVEVVAALQPQLVVFASRLAAKHSRGAAAQLHEFGIRTVTVPHPSCFVVESALGTNGRPYRATAIHRGGTGDGRSGQLIGAPR
jgi:hypothetical protein